MRVLTLLIMLVLGLGSFSAVAHGYGVDLIHCSADQQNTSADFYKDCTQSSENGDDGKNAASHICTNCGHSCVSFAFLPHFNVVTVMPAIKFVFGITNTDIDTDFPAKLIRPPKTLV